jgi:hypothetical protein
VITTRGEAALLFLFYFFSAALTAEIAAAAAEADYFPTADLVRHRAFAVPPASGVASASPPPALSPVSSSASTDESDS